MGEKENDYLKSFALLYAQKKKFGKHNPLILHQANRL